ncbi:MAG: (d)CMP kinase [Francisellaceae bacterium]
MQTIITIDGPSGVGKGTLARLLATHFNYNLLDSGAIYRLAALYALKTGTDLDDEAAVADLMKSLHIVFRVDNGVTRSYLDNEDVSDAIRTQNVAMAASSIAKLPSVRTALLKKQQDFACNSKGLVADGRDMGTVVFPHARYKFFLEASSEIRAKRRYDEYIIKGLSPDYKQLLEEIKARDYQDRNRAVAPLKPAKDAIVIDTGSLNINEVFSAVLHHLGV